MNNGINEETTIKKLRKLAVCIENEEKEDIVIIFAEPTLKDIEEVIKDEDVLEIVTDFIYNEKKDDVEGVKKERRKGEEVLLDMWERERGDKVIKKESEEEDEENEVCDDTIQNHNQEILQRNLESSEKVEQTEFVESTEIVEPTEFVDVLLDEGSNADSRVFQDNHFRSCPERGKIKRQRKGHEEKSFSCEFCLKTFKTRDRLNKHTHSHTKPFSCDICGKNFSTKQSMNMHKETHLNNKSYSCDKCNKVFSRITLFLSHKKNTHSERKVSCDICGKLFFDKNKLIIHSRVHTKEKPFTCDICGKAFSQIPHLDRHKRTHTGEKPHSCDICGKLFAAKDNLNLHKKLHADVKPYPCECGKAFPYKKSLYIHKIEVHNEHDNTLDNDTFICDVCERPFANIHRLKRHQLTHTGERPFPCDVCGRAFAVKGNLTVHKKIHSETKKEIT